MAAATAAALSVDSFPAAAAPVESPMTRAGRMDGWRSVSSRAAFSLG